MDKFMNKPKCVTDPYGTKSWWLNGKLHREDGPAIINTDGSKSWYLNGKRHREDGPALIFTSGHKEWYLNDERHREDGPAIIWADGRKQWFLNNKPIYNPIICSFIVNVNKVEQKMFASEAGANKFMIEKLSEDVTAWMNLNQ